MRVCSPSYGQIAVQTVFYSLGWQTVLEKGNSEFKTLNYRLNRLTNQQLAKHGIYGYTSWKYGQSRRCSLGQPAIGQTWCVRLHSQEIWSIREVFPSSTSIWPSIVYTATLPEGTVNLGGVPPRRICSGELSFMQIEPLQMLTAVNTFQLIISSVLVWYDIWGKNKNTY